MAAKKKKAMTSKELAILKDNLLRAVMKNTPDVNFSLEDFVDKHNSGMNTTTAIIEDLALMGLLRTTEVTRSKDIDPLHCYLVMPESKTYFFLNVEGGFTAKYKAQQIKKIWTVVKIIAAVINAIIIISIACIGLYFQLRFNKIEKEREDLKQTVETLQKAIDLRKNPPRKGP
jgi:hypothetical protein